MDPHLINLKKTMNTSKVSKKQPLSSGNQKINFEEILLSSPSSKKMKNSLIYKIDSTDASNLKLRVNTLLTHRNLSKDIIRLGTVPSPRDGHSALIHNDEMIVFGGDRNKFPFNDLFFFKI